MNKNIPEIISYLTGKDYKDLNILEDNYKNLRALEFAIQNLFNISSAVVPADNSKKNLLEIYLGLTDKLDEYVSNIIKSNNTFLEEYLG